MIKHFWALFKARNLEFFRDKSSLSWNLAFPLLILVGFSFIFDGNNRPQYKVGVLESNNQTPELKFEQLDHLAFVSYQDSAQAQLKVQQHKLDLLISPYNREYWVNPSSPKGYIVEHLLIAMHPDFTRLALEGREIRYLDWVVPGILGMNMMFSCLFGVGYVIVRYRKNSVLKRLHATPLSALEFLLAQVMSRLFIVLSISTVIFTGCNWLFNFYMLGSYWNLLLVATLGAISMISMGLLVASRVQSEELAGGLLNLVSWPMMILSGVWFSLEGAPHIVQQIAMWFPLTQMLMAARAVMNDGASLANIADHLLALGLMSALFLCLGAWLFRWHGEGR